ncbi:hypothetical protein HMPREF0880_04440 [Yokenella regensburgei ATCC 43003]|nr:hypothetical protein HMPREF0880_04440 [Yokenella regensburgei ATCC 43003]
MSCAECRFSIDAKCFRGYNAARFCIPYAKQITYLLLGRL